MKRVDIQNRSSWTLISWRSPTSRTSLRRRCRADARAMLQKIRQGLLKRLLLLDDLPLGRLIEDVLPMRERHRALRHVRLNHRKADSIGDEVVVGSVRPDARRDLI